MRTCTTCGNALGVFRDELSVKEASLSGMCQRCQDEFFGNATCPACGGSGDDPDGRTATVKDPSTDELISYAEECSLCDGKGKVYDKELFWPCPLCQGSGDWPGSTDMHSDPCGSCGSRGEVPITPEDLEQLKRLNLVKRPETPNAAETGQSLREP